MVTSLNEQYRKLSEGEINLLTSRGCSAEDWGLIDVKQEFSPFSCRNVNLSGRVKLGVFDKNRAIPAKPGHGPGITNATIHNCVIGDNVTIFNVHGYIANYILEEGVFIENCGRIYADGVSSFGNGASIAVLDESGGRSIKIYDKLSSHLAFLFASYRHRPALIEQFDRLVAGYASEASSEMGVAGKGAVIKDCHLMRNVRVGGNALIDGALRLEEGTVLSSESAPAHIGHGVILNNFIVCSGARITGGVIIERCFVGQGCLLEKQFSATDSLFFSNCQGFHGEAISVFAGPYTVSHHKSTLLIAGMFSFMNAGSGSNQSNHLYKLGPVHHGIMERGSKTASGAYLLWPGHIGPFSLVVGHHGKSIDTSLFPFSYVMENNGETFVYPAINLRSTGTVRDIRKWPARDLRTDQVKHDHINHGFLTPYTAGRILKALRILEGASSKIGRDEDLVFHNFKIKASAAQKGMDLYNAAIKIFTGNSIIKRLKAKEFRSSNDLSLILGCSSPEGRGEWTDLAGLIAPVARINEICDMAEKGTINTLPEIEARLGDLHQGYDELEWSWVSEIVGQMRCKEPEALSPAEILEIIDEWVHSETGLHNMVLDDARKEFSEQAMTGFGAGLGESERESDFREVRGDFESNRFIKEFREEFREKVLAAEEIAGRLRLLIK